MRYTIRLYLLFYLAIDVALTRHIQGGILFF